MRQISKNYVKEMYPKREPQSRKGDFGKLLVVGGSRRYSGAPALAALAALRSGCDLVTVASPERAANIIASFSPDLITEPLVGNCFNGWHTRAVLELAEHADAVVLGSGMGKKRETVQFVHNLLSRLEKPCVIDADAIHAVRLNKKLLKPNFVLTPHSGEFLALSDQKPSSDFDERTGQVKLFSRHLGCTILLKGHVDVISDGKHVAINKTGTPFMTKGGTGDVLSGICGSLLSRKAGPFPAACSGAYLAGLSGEIASRETGPGTLASEVVGCIPKAIKSVIA
jgi:hydroxyethylthiazole kinase-like uncharacterized protein yjeF